MKNEKTLPFTPSERREILKLAREAGEISYDRLDRLVVESATTAPKMRGLLRSLHGVRVAISRDPNDILHEPLEIDFALGSGSDSNHFNRYAEQVRRLPRLNRNQEHLLARRLEFARERLRDSIRDMSISEDLRETLLMHGVNCDEDLGETKSDTLPCSQLSTETREAAAEYGRLREHFVQRNLYLVVGMASAYRTYGLPMMDLIQEGNASLIRAVEKYDWRKDVRFQTYAAFWIRQAVERLITANRGIVRVPNYVQQKMRRLRREGKLPRNHKDMDARDVSQHFDMNLKTAVHLMETDRSWFSLDMTFRDDDNNGTLGSTLAADEEDETMSRGEFELLERRLEDVLKECLTEQEQDIITMRFGLGGTKPRTLDQIGALMSVSRERIRQMQVKALDKLQKPRLLEALRDFL